MKILKISVEKQDFWKVWMKCLEIARLQDFAPNTPGFLGALSGPRPFTARCAIRDASRRTPLWKFLSTGLYRGVYTVYDHLYIKDFIDRKSEACGLSSSVIHGSLFINRGSTGQTMLDYGSILKLKIMS